MDDGREAESIQDYYHHHLLRILIIIVIGPSNSSRGGCGLGMVVWNNEEITVAASVKAAAG